MFSPILYYGLIKPLSLLPIRLLYRLGSFSALLLRGPIAYRRKVVRENLSNAFPEMDPEERGRVEKTFYRHLGDLIAESIKFFSIRRKEAEKMLQCRNPELPRRYFEEGKHIILAGGHFNNWELYAMGAPFHLDHHAFALYKPLRDRFFDRVMKRTRERFGLKMIPIRKGAHPFQMKEPTATIFATDQAPKNTRNVHWMEFLNQDTPVMKGVERFARQYGIPVIFGTIQRLGRGRYEVIYELITDDPGSCEEGWITEAHTEALEREIKERPEHWLWTHRRWKKKRRT